MDRGAWQATVHGVTRAGHDLVTKPPYLLCNIICYRVQSIVTSLEGRPCMSPFIQHSGKGKTTGMENPLSVGAWTMGKRGSSWLQKGHLGEYLRIIMYGSAMVTEWHYISGSVGICCIAQGTQTGALWQVEGWDEEGDRRKVQEGGDMGVPVADSCWCLTENHKIL